MDLIYIPKTQRILFVFVKATQRILFVFLKRNGSILFVFLKCNAQKCDVWSLGVIMFMMLTGMPPFGGNGERDIMDAVARNDISFYEEDWVQMPEAATLVKSMLVSERIANPNPPKTRILNLSPNPKPEP